MCVQRMQEGGAGDAVCSSAPLKTRRVHRTCVATDDVVSAAARIVGIVYAKFGVIENVENICVEIELTKFGELEVLDQSHIKIQPARVVQEVSTSIAKGQPSRRHKLRWISLEWAKALKVVRRLGQAMHHVRVRGCDP